MLYLVLYRIVGYRKKVVSTNLRKSFPKYSVERLEALEKRFYRYFCDLILESIKNLTIGRVELERRLVFEDLTPFKKHFEKNQSVVVVMGHLGNWELGGSRFAIEPLHKMYIIYHPQSNQQVDAMLCKMRSRFGNGLYPMQSAFRKMTEHKDDLTATTFISDQTPPFRTTFKLQFLNQETRVYLGASKLAKRFNYPVIYAGIKRVRRGHYSIKLEELVVNPTEHTVEGIARLFYARLESDIRELPETWLWSHRRWKHNEREEQMKLQQQSS